MTERYTKFNVVIKNIEFKMIRKGENCWIKAEPINRVSIPSSLHIILNGEEHHWDIYNESGRESHKVYFKGYESTPSFYLKSKQNCFRIDCDYDNIKTVPITETHKFDTYMKDNCYCTSSQASCWAVAIYHTTEPDKPPFNEM